MNDRLIFLESFLEELYDEHVDSFTYIMEQPRSSWESMLSMTNEMYDRMQEYVNGYMFKHSLPSSVRYAVEQQLFVLLVPSYSPRSIYDNTSLISEVVNDLEANNPTHKISTRPPVKMECMKDIEHFIY